MSRRPAFVAFVALVALASMLGGCGGDKGPNESVLEDATSTTVAGGSGQGESGDAQANGDSHAGEAPDEHPKYTVENPPTESFRPPDDTSEQPGTLPLEARITPGCVEWGQTVRFELKTKPGADFGMQVKWPSEQFSDLPNKFGKADDTGTVTWSVEVGPNALTGEAHLMVAVAVPESGEPGSTGDFRFLVGRPGRC